MTPEEAAAKAQYVMEMIHQKSALDCAIDGEEYVIAALLDAVRQERERCAKIADYWAEGHWRVTHDKRSRFSIYDMQRVNVTTAQEIAKDIREMKLCEGEAAVERPEQRTIANAVTLKHES